MFIWTKTALWLATGILALFGGVGWALALWDKSIPLACMVAVVAAIAPIVAASMTGPAIRGGGVFAWACVLIFVLMDGGSNTNAGWQADSFALSAINGPATEAYAADLVVAKGNLQTAQAALVALPTPSVDGPIKRLDTYATTAAILTATRDSARADLDALTPPVMQHLLPREVMGVVLFLTSFAVIFGFLGVHSAEARARKATAVVKPAPIRKPRATPAPKVNLRAVVAHDDLVTRMQRA
jgi:hypothetical protein